MLTQNRILPILITILPVTGGKLPTCPRRTPPLWIIRRNALAPNIWRLPLWGRRAAPQHRHPALVYTSPF